MNAIAFFLLLFVAAWVVALVQEILSAMQNPEAFRAAWNSRDYKHERYYSLIYPLIIKTLLLFVCFVITHKVALFAKFF